MKKERVGKRELERTGKRFKRHIEKAGLRWQALSDMEEIALNGVDKETGRLYTFNCRIQEKELGIKELEKILNEALTKLPEP